MTDLTRSARDLFGYGLHARDGALGRVHDLYFDDRRWIVRYVVVDLHRWRPGRRVLISPVCVRHVDARRRQLDVSLDLDHIRRAPDVDADRPVSRQHEIALHEYSAFRGTGRTSRPPHPTIRTCAACAPSAATRRPRVMPLSAT
jgi:hypothetical protein